MISVRVNGSATCLPDFGASCQMVSALIRSCDLPTALLPDLAVKATGLGLRNLVEGAKDFMLNAIINKFCGKGCTAMVCSRFGRITDRSIQRAGSLRQNIL